MVPTFEKGLFAVGDGVHAYLQPDGSWGYSNAGLVVGDGASLLVDTLFDLQLTQEMLDAMAPVTASAPITTVVNTHANGDHYYGNQLVAGPGVEIVASAEACEEMGEPTPQLLHQMLSMEFAPETSAFVQRAFGPFRFDDIQPVAPTRPFSGRTTIVVGGREVEVVEVGPAHSPGDVVVWVSDSKVVFAGDILFIGGTPIMWAGPIENWIAACERIIAWAPEVVVPGHGPLTDVDGVARVAAYLRFVDEGARRCFEAGMTSQKAADDVDQAVDDTEFGAWTDRERIDVTVDRLYHFYDPSLPETPILDLLNRMGRRAADRERV